MNKNLDVTEQISRYCPQDHVTNNVFTLYYLLEDILAENNITLFQAKKF